MWEIAAEGDAATAPAEGRKSAYFQEEISFFLTEATRLAPIVNLQPRNDRVLRQWSWIEQPAVGNDVLQFQKIFLAQLPSPKFAKRLQPEKREPHFLFQ